MPAYAIVLCYSVSMFPHTSAAERRLRSVSVGQGSMTLCGFPLEPGGCVTNPCVDVKSSAVVYFLLWAGYGVFHVVF